MQLIIFFELNKLIAHLQADVVYLFTIFVIAFICLLFIISFILIFVSARTEKRETHANTHEYLCECEQST